MGEPATAHGDGLTDVMLDYEKSDLCTFLFCSPFPVLALTLGLSEVAPDSGVWTFEYTEDAGVRVRTLEYTDDAGVRDLTLEYTDDTGLGVRVLTLEYTEDTGLGVRVLTFE